MVWKAELLYLDVLKRRAAAQEFIRPDTDDDDSDGDGGGGDGDGDDGGGTRRNAAPLRVRRSDAEVWGVAQGVMMHDDVAPTDDVAQTHVMSQC